MLSKSEHRSVFSAGRRERRNPTRTARDRSEESSHGLADQWIRDSNRNTIRALLILGGADFGSTRRGRFQKDILTPQDRWPRERDPLALAQ